MSPAARSEIPQLHFIRALAMVGIFFHHLWNGLGDVHTLHKDDFLDIFFVKMALGVVVFNVMTAWLAAMPYVGEDARPLPDYLSYVAKRLWRLAPLFYVCVVVFSVLTWLIWHATPDSLVSAGIRHFLFLDAFSYSNFMSNTAAYWWLSLLAQFTLVFPLLIGLINRYGVAKTTMWSCIICWPLAEIVRGLGVYFPNTFMGEVSYLWGFNLPARLPEFFIGMWMAAIVKSRPGASCCVDKVLGRLLIVAFWAALAMALLPGTPIPFVSNTVFALCAFVLLFALPGAKFLGRRKEVLWLSAASYGIYLTHQPILSYVDKITPGIGPWGKFAFLAVVAGALSVAATLGVEKVTNRIVALIEPKPAR